MPGWIFQVVIFQEIIDGRLLSVGAVEVGLACHSRLQGRALSRSNCFLECTHLPLQDLTAEVRTLYAWASFLGNIHNECRQRLLSD